MNHEISHCTTLLLYHSNATFVLFHAESLMFYGCVSGDGCGHTVLGVGSGSLASLGYPLSYPSNSVCEWEISVSPGQTIRVHIADLDINKNNCQVSYLRLYKGIGLGRSEIGEKILTVIL